MIAVYLCGAAFLVFGVLALIERLTTIPQKPKDLGFQAFLAYIRRKGV